MSLINLLSERPNWMKKKTLDHAYALNKINSDSCCNLNHNITQIELRIVNCEWDAFSTP